MEWVDGGKAGLYVGLIFNYCQSHMFWWIHGCYLLSKFANFKMCFMTRNGLQTHI